MLYSQLFGKTQKNTKAHDSMNAFYLIKGGFIDSVMAGVYTFLPLGHRVIEKIENIVRNEMNAFSSELLMPVLAPKTLWEKTGRLDTFDSLFKAVAANARSKAKNDSEYIISPTHEEVITPLAQKNYQSFRDFPISVYQIQTKFRNEPRPKSGLLRGREFRMKDLYSFHATAEDLKHFYEKVMASYMNIFHKLGIGNDTVVTLAPGGEFSKSFSHEFQTLCDTGEDTIFYSQKEKLAYNSHVANDKKLDSSYQEYKAVEVGNIFSLDTAFSEPFDYCYIDAFGKKQPVHMGCYGLGTSRAMGVIAEKFHDEKGILWPKNVAPYLVHLMVLSPEKHIIKKANEAYKKILSRNIETLFDNRENVSPGEKFADADLIGIPYRLLLSDKTKNTIELKRRNEAQGKIMTLEEALKKIESHVSETF